MNNSPKATQIATELQQQFYSKSFPTYSNDQLFDLTEKFTEKLIAQSIKQIDDYFEPFIRKTGVKGEITKGKLRWRGIKMYIYSGADYTAYQLHQRGVKISPKLKVDIFGRITYPALSILELKEAIK